MQQGFEIVLLAEQIDRERREAAARLHARHRVARVETSRRSGTRRWSLRLPGSVLTIALRHHPRPAAAGR